MTGDSEWPMGFPHTAARRLTLMLCTSLGDGTHAPAGRVAAGRRVESSSLRVSHVRTQQSGIPFWQAFWMFASCSALVTANADLPVLSMATKNSHSPVAGF